jgi:manganese oxidase
MSRNRRDFFWRALSGAGMVAAARVARASTAEAALDQEMNMEPGAPSVTMRGQATAMSEPVRAGFLPVQTPDLPDLPWNMENGVKVFHLVAEPVKRQIHPRKTLDLWGYNGTSPGPTIQVMQGDRVRIIVENHLPEPTSMHWHGFEIPNDMDGVPGVVQDPIPPGGRFVYEFTLHQEGTYFYHSHMAMQEMMGMIGAFIMHPKKLYEPRVNKDFAIILQEYAVLPNNSVPNTMSMEFNWLTFNGKVGPAITPLIVRLEDHVRIRLINIGMDHHPIHLHGNTFYVTGTEGGRAPESTWRPENTVLVGVAQTRDVEFDAKYPGDWMLHCHLPHHMMNQMSSTVGPMTRLSQGMPAGLGMEEGMGMLTGSMGAPLGEDYGPGLGRGLGVGSTNNQPTGNTPLSPEKAQSTTQDMHGMRRGGRQMPRMSMHNEISSNANSVPGFPQDAYMEGPMMAMDQAVWKPENYGLRPGWSGFMQGMMTLVRVLPPDQYDKMMGMIRQNRQDTIPYTSAMWNIPGTERQS